MSVAYENFKAEIFNFFDHVVIIKREGRKEGSLVHNEQRKKIETSKNDDQVKAAKKQITSFLSKKLPLFYFMLRVKNLKRTNER
jgi:hypothetical protein